MSNISTYSFASIVPFLFVVFVILLPLIVRLPIALGYRKKAKERLPELFALINATNYKFEHLFSKGLLYVSFSGQYKAYKVKCQYTIYKNNFNPKRGHYINIICETHLAKSKIPIFQFMVEYPKVYKDYIFDGKNVYLSSYDIGESSLSRGRAVELLDDIIKACELVENPDFKVNL